MLRLLAAAAFAIRTGRRPDIVGTATELGVHAAALAVGAVRRGLSQLALGAAAAAKSRVVAERQVNFNFLFFDLKFFGGQW